MIKIEIIPIKIDQFTLAMKYLFSLLLFVLMNYESPAHFFRVNEGDFLFTYVKNSLDENGEDIIEFVSLEKIYPGNNFGISTLSGNSVTKKKLDFKDVHALEFKYASDHAIPGGTKLKIRINREDVAVYIDDENITTRFKVTVPKNVKDGEISISENHPNRIAIYSGMFVSNDSELTFSGIESTVFTNGKNGFYAHKASINIPLIGAFEFWNNSQYIPGSCYPHGMHYVKENLDFRESEENFIHKLKEGNIYVIPNPASNQITVYPANIKEGIYSLEIFDSNSRAVISISAYDVLNRKTIDISGLKSGLYYVSLQSANHKYYTKFIKTDPN